MLQDGEKIEVDKFIGLGYDRKFIAISEEGLYMRQYNGTYKLLANKHSYPARADDSIHLLGSSPG